MIRPEKWDDLPGCLLEYILDNCELDYCHYESSRVEAIHELTCNPEPNHRNYQSAQSYYKAMSDVDLHRICNEAITTLRWQTASLEAFLEKKS